MRLLTATLLILIACSALPAADDSLIAGRAALDRRDSDQAIAQFEKVVAQKPKSSVSFRRACVGVGAGLIL
jgi:hypothetical protein